MHVSYVPCVPHVPHVAQVPQLHPRVKRNVQVQLFGDSKVLLGVSVSVKGVTAPRIWNQRSTESNWVEDNLQFKQQNI